MHPLSLSLLSFTQSLYLFVSDFFPPLCPCHVTPLSQGVTPPLSALSTRDTPCSHPRMTKPVPGMMVVSVSEFLNPSVGTLSSRLICRLAPVTCVLPYMGWPMTMPMRLGTSLSPPNHVVFGHEPAHGPKGRGSDTVP